MSAASRLRAAAAAAAVAGAAARVGAGAHRASPAVAAPPTRPTAPPPLPPDHLYACHLPPGRTCCWRRPAAQTWTGTARTSPPTRRASAARCAARLLGLRRAARRRPAARCSAPGRSCRLCPPAHPPSCPACVAPTRPPRAAGAGLPGAAREEAEPAVPGRGDPGGRDAGGWLAGRPATGLGRRMRGWVASTRAAGGVSNGPLSPSTAAARRPRAWRSCPTPSLHASPNRLHCCCCPQAESVALMPNVNNACGEEIRAHCGKVGRAGCRAAPGPRGGACAAHRCTGAGARAPGIQPRLPRCFLPCAPPASDHPAARAPPAQVPRGQGRVLNCLLAAAVHHPDFGPSCAQHLAGLARRRLYDWRTGGWLLPFTCCLFAGVEAPPACTLGAATEASVGPAHLPPTSHQPTDYQLARACEDEAARLCGAARGAAGDASVFACLVGSVGGGGLSGACAAEVVRTARTGLDFYELVGRIEQGGRASMSCCGAARLGASKRARLPAPRACCPAHAA